MAARVENSGLPSSGTEIPVSAKHLGNASFEIIRIGTSLQNPNQMKLTQFFNIIRLLILWLILPFSGSFLMAQNDLLLSKAYEAAWSGKYVTAIQLFDQISESDIHFEDALAGKAWTHSWKGDYKVATTLFSDLKALNPESQEVEKGLAYVALWSGDERAAKAAFTRLLISMPDQETEWRSALSTLYLGEGEHLKARTQLSYVPEKQVDPVQLAAIQSSPAFFETSFWGGYSRLGESNRFGLRALQINWNPTPNQSVWARVDNSLTLDHRTLFSRDTGAMAFFVGGKINPTKSLILSGEIGQRFLPDQGNQQLISLEPTWYLWKNTGWKSGFLYVNNSSIPDQKLAYTGLILEVLPSVWLEPQLFYLWENQEGPRQLRGNLNLKYRNAKSGQEVNVGATFAPESNNSDPILGTTIGGWVQYQHPLGSKHWIFALARMEHNNLETLTNIALGMRFRLEQ